MKNSQKAKGIVLGCALAVGVISSVIIWKNYRPSPGRPYEQITMQQARDFMTYETGYVLADIGTQEEYEKGHLENAVNIPYEKLGVLVTSLLPQKDQQIYVYGRDKKQSEMAARKLCELGYTNISEITDALSSEEESSE